MKKTTEEYAAEAKELGIDLYDHIASQEGIHRHVAKNWCFAYMYGGQPGRLSDKYDPAKHPSIKEFWPEWQNVPWVEPRESKELKEMYIELHAVEAAIERSMYVIEKSELKGRLVELLGRIKKLERNL